MDERAWLWAQRRPVPVQAIKAVPSARRSRATREVTYRNPSTRRVTVMQVPIWLEG